MTGEHLQPSSTLTCLWLPRAFPQSPRRQLLPSSRADPRFLLSGHRCAHCYQRPRERRAGRPHLPGGARQRRRALFKIQAGGSGRELAHPALVLCAPSPPPLPSLFGEDWGRDQEAVFLFLTPCKSCGTCDIPGGQPTVIRSRNATPASTGMSKLASFRGCEL